MNFCSIIDGFTVRFALCLCFSGITESPVNAKQAKNADDDEGNGKHLTLVESDDTDHFEFPRLLHFLEDFHKEAEGKDGSEAETEEESGPYALGPSAVKPKTDEEEHAKRRPFKTCRSISCSWNNWSTAKRKNNPCKNDLSR